MNAEELHKMVMALIDEHALELSAEEYVKCMYEISEETAARAVAGDVGLEN